MKKYFQASSKTVGYVQNIAMIGTIIGSFFVSWSLGWALLAIAMFYAFSAVGVSMMHHRYFSHKGFEFKSPLVKWLCISIATLAGRGSPLAWVYVHRLHHAYADTEKDPHSPEFGFKFFNIKSTTAANKIDQLFMIRDMLSKSNVFINDWYVALVLAFPLLLTALFGFQAAFFFWFLPVCINQLALDFFTYFTHVEAGYRTTETRDNSRNVTWLWPIVLGEAWHNNHHASPKDPHYGKGKFEFDPIYYLIKLVSK